ncbi:FtsX-like permease family protein [Maribacter sp. X9]|uniref:FtsX-like permease family protein n=1 Tax=Maribacter sp. X9 TaxID=3402159 RepID=UPI003AF36B39
MFKNYIKIAWRNLLKNKGFTIINVGGLAMGMAVALFIGLWIYDELSFNSAIENHNRIAQVLMNKTGNGEIRTRFNHPYPMADELRNVYGDDFEHVVMSSFPGDNVLSVGDKQLNEYGVFMEKEALRMFSFRMLKGNQNALQEPNAIVISESTAKAFFGEEDPLEKAIYLNNDIVVTVKGVFKNFPNNANIFDALSAFSEVKTLQFVASWDLYVVMNDWVKTARDQKLWDNNSYLLYAQIAEHTTMAGVSDKIKNVLHEHVPEDTKRSSPRIFLHPMKDWHLRSTFKNGVAIDGAIQYVRLFGIIGIFVLLLACINFMNLSTARAQKRAKEVGIRKTLGSLKNQLVSQFMLESLLVTLFAFILACGLVLSLLPFFNQLSDKQIKFPFTIPIFWMICVGLVLVTSLLAGSYPALYLSSFRPVKVLKGTLRTGKSVMSFRKVLVVVQFTVSIVLVASTVLVNRQIQHSKNRTVGYVQDGLIMVEKTTNDFEGKYNTLREALKNTGAVVEMAESSSPLTEVWNTNGGFDWKGKDPDFDVNIVTFYVSHDYGSTVDWNIAQGRDFSREFASDSTAYILNEAAVKYMGLDDPVGKRIRWYDGEHKVIGVVKDLLVESPFEPVKQAIYTVNYGQTNWITLKLAPGKNFMESLDQVETIFRNIAPDVPFQYQFVDATFGYKFKTEERMRKLAGIFSALAILISCLGLFGLATFMAEQRTKEIGIRKVLGASVPSLFKMLSKDFVVLIMLSGLIAVPVAYHNMQQWLENYTYRTDMPWWVFGGAILGVLFVAILTVSYHALRAARANPVKSLRTE